MYENKDSEHPQSQNLSPLATCVLCFIDFSVAPVKRHLALVLALVSSLDFFVMTDELRPFLSLYSQLAFAELAFPIASTRQLMSILSKHVPLFAISRQ